MMTAVVAVSCRDGLIDVKRQRPGRLDNLRHSQQTLAASTHSRLFNISYNGLSRDRRGLPL
jgi:hypothetical protein